MVLQKETETILVMLFVCMGMLGHPNGTKPDHAAAIIPARKPTHQLKIHCEDSEIQNRLFGCKLIGQLASVRVTGILAD